MAKRRLPVEAPEQEYLDLENDVQPAAEPSGWSRGVSAASQYGFGVIKFILGLGLVPFVYCSTSAFLNEMKRIEGVMQADFWAGILTFVVTYFFIWEPAVVYSRGQKILGAVFQFFTPLVKVAPYLLPIYTLIVFAAHGIASLVWGAGKSIHYAIFFAGFTIALHLVFSAKTVRGKKGDFLKGNYIFGFSFVYVTNLALLALCLNLVFGDFSFVQYFSSAFTGAKNMYAEVFRQLFISRTA